MGKSVTCWEEIRCSHLHKSPNPMGQLGVASIQHHRAEVFLEEVNRQGGRTHNLSAYLSTFRNFHGGDSARIDVFDPFFFTTKRGENLLEFPWARHFSYLQSGLDITIKTFISRIINCIILQTNAFIKNLKWRNILYHKNLY